MASRVVEVLYKLKDLFTGQVKKITAGYRDIEVAASRTADRIDKSTAKSAGVFDKFSSGISRARTALTAFYASAVAGTVIAGVSSVANELDRLGKAAGKLNIDPGLLSAYGFAAERSGIQVSVMEKALADLQRRTGEAALGLGEARIAFEQLGIDAEQFAKLGLEQQMLILADRFSRVSEEETKAALAAKIFGEAGTELLKAINGGADAFARLVSQGKAYRKVTKEQTDAAAAYNDALTDLQATVDGIKFEKLTPLISFFGKGLSVRGLGDPIQGLRTELALLEEQIQKPFLSRLLGFRGTTTVGSMEQRIYEIQKELAKLDEQTEESIKTGEREAEARKRQAEAAGLYKVEVEQLTDAYGKQVAAQKKALDQETNELRKARSDQLSVEQEFAKLREDVTATSKEDITGLDIQTKILEAKRKLASGDSDAAIKSARQGGDLLRQLQEQGDEAGYVLSFLAKQLETVANTAAQRKVDSELLDVGKAEQQLDGVKNKLDALKSDAVIKGDELGRAFVAAIQGAFDSAQLTLPSLPGNTPDVVRQGIDSYRRQLDKRGGK